MDDGDRTKGGETMNQIVLAVILNFVVCVIAFFAGGALAEVFPYRERKARAKTKPKQKAFPIRPDSPRQPGWNSVFNCSVCGRPWMVLADWDRPNGYCARCGTDVDFAKELLVIAGLPKCSRETPTKAANQ